MRQEATAEGLLDSAVNTRYEMALRPEALRWADWIQAQIGKIKGALDAMERECQGFDNRITMAQIAFGAALGYLDFRFADLEWRTARPALTAWYEAFSNGRPCSKPGLPRPEARASEGYVRFPQLIIPE